MAKSKRVVVVGGGLAGLTAALDLAEAGWPVTVFESRGKLGGRASSFDDEASVDAIDLCQHVAMGACTHTIELCRRLGADDFFRREKVIHFLDESGTRSDFSGNRWLPAPLHLATAFARLKFLTASEQRAAAAGVWALLRLPVREQLQPPISDMSMAQWLTSIGQPPRVIERFWSLVLTSALGETLDRAALHAGRKVFVEGFASHADAYHVLVPARSFDALYEQHFVPALEQRGATIVRKSAVRELVIEKNRVAGVKTAAGFEPARVLIVAVPWFKAADLLRPIPVASDLAARIDRLQSSAITSVHLWFDQAPFDFDQVALVGRLSQWFFTRPVAMKTQSPATSFHVQAVISASREILGRDRDELVAQVEREIREASPRGHSLRLQGSRVVHQPDAVYSPTVEAWRNLPSASTPIRGLFLAGDWTATGWPATMEGAIRSGHTAANCVQAMYRRAPRKTISDLPPSWLMRWITR